MYISDTDINKKAGKTAFVYLLISLFCVLFGAVYELYSHEVYSYYMLYAFVFPLGGGTLPFSALSLAKVRKYPNALACNVYHSGIGTLTVGSVIEGILEIYGTSNSKTQAYWYVGIFLVVLGIVLALWDTRSRRTPKRKPYEF